MLLWHLKYGKRESWFEELEEEDDAKFNFLDEKPVLYPDLYSDWKAFWVLSGSRQIGMGLGSIQVSEIYAYMKMLNISESAERELLLTRIQILDRVYLEYNSKEIAKKKPKKGKR